MNAGRLHHKTQVTHSESLRPPRFTVGDFFVQGQCLRPPHHHSAVTQHRLIVRAPAPKLLRMIYTLVDILLSDIIRKHIQKSLIQPVLFVIRGDDYACVSQSYGIWIILAVFFSSFHFQICISWCDFTNTIRKIRQKRNSPVRTSPSARGCFHITMKIIFT